MEPSRRIFTMELAGFAALGPPQPRSVPRKNWQPAYLELNRTGELARRNKTISEIYRSCRLCPRACGVNRLKGETGVCRTTSRIKIASAHPHFGEEPPLVGRKGSGTVFFSNCNLQCVFCQNWEINHRGDGSPISDEELAHVFIRLQDIGCHNINLVTPTHVLPNIITALRWAIPLGLNVPLVYNCGGYEPVEVIRLLDGIMDIYLPDFKYMDGKLAATYSNGASDYPEAAAAAIEEMNRQVGELTVDEKGVALRGLIIRHLVMPENIAGTDKFVKWAAAKLGPQTWVNIMPQYRPEHRAREFPAISRRITSSEFSQALEWARQAGLRNVMS